MTTENKKQDKIELLVLEHAAAMLEDQKTHYGTYVARDKDECILIFVKGARFGFDLAVQESSTKFQEYEAKFEDLRKEVSDAKHELNLEKVCVQEMLEDMKFIYAYFRHEMEGLKRFEEIKKRWGLNE
jgi:hypothetical protein